MAAFSSRVRRSLAAACLMAVTACSATYENHGYVPPERDVENLIVGVDGRATVDDVIGPPSLSGMVSDGDYYYVRSRQRANLMFRPEIIEREVLAISFNEDDTIANIERLRLADGKAVPISSRVTETSVVKAGFIRQLLNNIGAFNPADTFGN